VSPLDLQVAKFEWNELKAANLKNHRVRSEEAKTVVNNPLALIFEDEIHSMDEPRKIIVGHSSKVAYYSFALGLQPERNVKNTSKTPLETLEIQTMSFCLNMSPIIKRQSQIGL